jgi:hypothetical protein
MRRRRSRGQLFHAVDYNKQRNDLNASCRARARVCVKLGKVCLRTKSEIRMPPVALAIRVKYIDQRSL